MTDNEIIKALDILDKHEFFGGQRAGRELWSKKPVDVQDKDVEDFAKDIAFLKDLINRQKAEIERLQGLVDEMGDYFPACIDCEGKTEFGERTEKCVYLTDTENYCIKKGISNIIAIQKENSSLKEALITARAEAIKEFAERLKSKLDISVCGYSTGEVVSNVEDSIDNLVKEMTEETKHE